MEELIATLVISGFARYVYFSKWTKPVWRSTWKLQYAEPSFFAGILKVTARLFLQKKAID